MALQRESLAASQGAAVTPIAFVHAIAAAYHQRGMDPEEALQAAQITPALLRDPLARITAKQMEAVSGHAMRELDDESLGWFSRRLPWGSYGMLARASISSAQLGQALSRWCRHHNLLTDDIHAALTVNDTTAEIVLTDGREPSPLREFCHVSVLRNVMGLACWFIDSRIPLHSSCFSFARPPHHDAYAVLFPGPVVFEGEHTAVRFDARYLTQPLRRDEPALKKMLQNALPLMVQSYKRDRLLVERIRQWLVTAPQEANTTDQLADALHVSPRTLNRQLQELGTSLQKIKDATRQEQAIEWLLRTDKPIKQIADAVGFASEKSFSRAFKDWTGSSPSAYRQQSQGRPSAPLA